MIRKIAVNTVYLFQTTWTDRKSSSSRKSRILLFQITKILFFLWVIEIALFLMWIFIELKLISIYLKGRNKPSGEA